MSEENSGTSAPEGTQAPVLESQENLDTLDEGQDLDLASQEKPIAKKKVEEKALEKKLKKLKLKVDGEEYEEEFDLDDDEYLTKQLQMAKMAQKRAQSYSQLEKEVAAFIQQLKTNPKKALASDLVGLDIKQLAAEIIEEEIERSQKSPEALEKERLEEELRAIKEEREREKEEARQKQLSEKQQQDFERYDRLFEKALETTDLPKTPYTVKRMADWMYLALDHGVEIEPQEVANLIYDEMKSELNQMFEVMPEEVIEKIIGENNLNRVRKKKIAAAKAKNASTQPIIGKPKETEQKQEVKKIKAKDFFGNF